MQLVHAVGLVLALILCKKNQANLMIFLHGLR